MEHQQAMSEMAEATKRYNELTEVYEEEQRTLKRIEKTLCEVFFDWADNDARERAIRTDMLCTLRDQANEALEQHQETFAKMMSTMERDISEEEAVAQMKKADKKFRYDRWSCDGNLMFEEWLAEGDEGWLFDLDVDFTWPHAFRGRPAHILGEEK